VTTIDLAFAALVVLAAVWGLARGAIRQIIDFVLLVASFAVPWRFAGPVAHLLQKPLAAPFSLVFLFSAFGLGLLVQATGRVAIAGLRGMWKKRRLAAAARKSGKSEEKGGSLSLVDRIAGAILGAARMALVLWVALSLLKLAEGDLVHSGYRLRDEDSDFLKLAGRYNAVAWVFGSEADALRRALRHLGDRSPGAHSRAWDDLLRDPRIDSMAHDQRLQRALADGDLRAFEQSPEMLSVLTDPDVLQKIQAALKAEVAAAATAAGGT
jgi:hypothetical protein